MTIYNQISANKNRTYLIFLLFIILFTGFFYLVGKFNGAQASAYAVMGFVISIGSSFFSYFFADKIVLATTGAKLASKEQYFDFYTVTENLCIASGMPMPKLYVMDDPSPNAFATGRDPKHGVVCATTGLLQMLDRAELEGVIAHELSHIKNYDILVMTIVAVLVGTLSLVADFMMRGAMFGKDDDGGKKNPIFLVLFIVALILMPIVATLIQLAISRKREFLADASGALLTRYPEGLARALEKIAGYPQPVHSATSSTAHLFISNPFKKTGGMSWMASLFSTHPPTEERLKILRSM